MVARGWVIDHVRVLGTVTLLASEIKKKKKKKKKGRKEEKGAGDRNCRRERKGSRSADNRSSVLISLSLLAAWFTWKEVVCAGGDGVGDGGWEGTASLLSAALFSNQEVRCC